MLNNKYSWLVPTSHEPNVCTPETQSSLNMGVHTDLQLWRDFRQCSYAVVLGQGILVEHHPLGQPQFARGGPVPGYRVHLSHMLMGQHEVVASAIHIPSYLQNWTQ